MKTGTGEIDNLIDHRKNNIDVYIHVEGDGKIPQYASKHAAGCDLYSTEDMAIRPGETKIMPLHFNMAIGTEIEAQIRPRSGLSLKTHLRIPNGPGTIDSDYRDMVGVILQNTYNIANLPYQIAQDPELLTILERDYREIRLSEYLSVRHTANSDTAAALTAIAATDTASESEVSVSANLAKASCLAVLSQMIYIDKHGNPFGTIYINKGERIAQMIFCEVKKANFITHANPREIGEDRGGGFGHTGKG